uniref:crotonase/enoyl-CoA hydratase family protein n=2 Tax=Roseivirga sp. TaxID=1964215 RepID=UPI0040480EB9
MTYHHFLVDIKDKIATVSFNRPDKANALHMEAWDEMRMIFNQLSDTPEARVIILKGEGKHFCAGIDLELLMSLNKLKEISCEGRRGEQLRKFILNLQDAVSSIEKCAKPVIAAIHNGCIGGGVDIAAACDMRYCTDDAYFTIKEIDMGMVADLGTLQRLPKLISPGIVAEMAFTARKVSGVEAASIGLTNRSFSNHEKLMMNVNEMASEIASKSPLSIRGIKEVLRYAKDHSVEDSLHQIATWNAAMILSDDLTEAFKASLEKRSGVYKD